MKKANTVMTDQKDSRARKILRPKEPKVSAIKDLSSLTQDERILVKWLRREAPTKEEVAKHFHLPMSEVYALVWSIRNKGYEVTLGAGRINLSREPKATQEPGILGDTSIKSIWRFLVIADTYLGNKYSQVTLLHTLYRIAQNEGVDFILHAGNLTTGVVPPNRSNEVFLETPDQQIEYATTVFPSIKVGGRIIKTHIISGGADATYLRTAGVNVVQGVCSKRDDLVYEGALERDYKLGSLRISVLHPGEDEAPYAKSYPLQGVAENIIESVQQLGDSRSRPDLVIMGGWQTAMEIPNAFGMMILSLPSLKSLTPYQKRKKKKAVVPTIGAIMVEVHFDKKGNVKVIDHGDGEEEKCIFWDAIDLSAYQIVDDYQGSAKKRKTAATMKVGVPADKKQDQLNDDHKMVLRYLLEGLRLGEIARQTGLEKRQVKAIIRQLQKKGYKISYDKASKRDVIEWEPNLEFTPLDISKLFVEEIKLGAISDPHLGGRAQRMSLVRKAYQIGEREGIQAMTHSGDMTDGFWPKYADHFADQFLIGADVNERYLIDNYPRSSRFKTELIAGSHDLTYWNHGMHDLLGAFAHERPDIHYVGRNRGITEVRGLKIGLNHPRGHTVYALSYPIQKIIEIFLNKIAIEGLEPNVSAYFVGHFHKAFFILYKGIACFTVPSLTENSPFMEAASYTWLGMIIVQFWRDADGNVTRIRPRFIPFKFRSPDKKTQIDA